MKRQNAFTLIEMIAVLVIIGIVIAIGIPAMSGLTRSAGVQGGTRQVSNTAQLARQFAITHRTQTELRMSRGAVAVFANNIQVDKWNNLPAGVLIDPNSAGSIVFKPNGSLVSPVDQIIIVREGVTNTAVSIVGTNSNISTVMVSSVLGRVAIQ
ncbi:MAG TPA: prepilin-type N-terminal cleavage/methylation domain-containing protein [Verrucomicrobiae bacterium]|nr:prepilin-type N-terminal cleavage/methylation domain-containing protein [Verrucomicrobiae bacterium]